jgi:hypothetical protein
VQNQARPTGRAPQQSDLGVVSAGYLRQVAPPLLCHSTQPMDVLDTKHDTRTTLHHGSTRAVSSLHRTRRTQLPRGAPIC